MGYDRGDNFPFNFEPNGIPFGSKSKGKLQPRLYPIQCERKEKYCFFSVQTTRVTCGTYAPFNHTFILVRLMYTVYTV